MHQVYEETHSNATKRDKERQNIKGKRRKREEQESAEDLIKKAKWLQTRMEQARERGELKNQLLERLQRAAESGYREGQRSVVELLDAQRTHTRVALRRLELLHAARGAQVALRAATGEFE